MYTRRRSNLRPRPSCCEFDQSALKQMKSLQQEQLSDQIFRSSKWYPLPCTGIHDQCCRAATASMCTTPSMSTASCASDVFTCALALSSASYVNNLTMFNLAACVEGVSLAIQWSALPIVIQSDCSELIKMSTDQGDNRSAYMMMIQEIKLLLRQDNREFIFKHVRREQNVVSHILANYGRIQKRTAVWLRSGPDEVPNLCNADLAAA